MQKKIFHRKKRKYAEEHERLKSGQDIISSSLWRPNADEYLFVARGRHLLRNNCGASLRRNYFICDSTYAAIIFKRLRWHLRR